MAVFGKLGRKIMHIMQNRQICQLRLNFGKTLLLFVDKNLWKWCNTNFVNRKLAKGDFICREGDKKLNDFSANRGKKSSFIIFPVFLAGIVGLFWLKLPTVVSFTRNHNLLKLNRCSIIFGRYVDIYLTENSRNVCDESIDCVKDGVSIFCQTIEQLSFSETQAELANMLNLPNSIKIKNPLNTSKNFN